MELHILPCRDVREPARIPIRHVRERFDLSGSQDTLRDLYAKHVHFVLPLPVGAAHQTELAPCLAGNLAAFELPECLDELVDVMLVGK
jgi:hypothetical protein